MCLSNGFTYFTDASLTLRSVVKWSETDLKVSMGWVLLGSIIFVWRSADRGGVGDH